MHYLKDFWEYNAPAYGYYSLDGYPCNANETVGKSLERAFIYGDLKFGPVKKVVYSRAFIPDKAHQSVPAGTGSEVAILIPANDFEKFKDSLTSTTFVLETHDEDISRRAFNSRNIDKYTELFKAEEGDAPAPVSPRVAAMASKSMSKQNSTLPSDLPPAPPKRSIGIQCMMCLICLSNLMVWLYSRKCGVPHRKR